MFPDTSLEPLRRDAYAKAEPFFLHHFTSLGPHYSLEYLGILPSAQHQGHGRALVTWGLDRANRQKVPVAVVCSAGSVSFYKKCGFDIHVGNVTEGDGNPLAEVEGGEILVFQPNRASEA